MSLSLAQARSRTYRKARVVLEGGLPGRIAALNASEGLVGDQQLVMPNQIAAGLSLGDAILSDLSVVDQYPVVSIYASTGDADIDVDSTYTVRTRYAVEVIDMTDGGAIDIAAIRTELLALCCVDLLREHMADAPEVTEQVIVSCDAPTTVFVTTQIVSRTAWQVSGAAEIEVVTRLDQPRAQTRVPWSMPLPSSIPSRVEALSGVVSGDSTPPYAVDVSVGSDAAAAITAAQAAGYTTLAVTLDDAVATGSVCTAIVLSGASPRSEAAVTADGTTFEFARTDIAPADGETWYFIVVDGDSGARSVFPVTWTIT